jgi:hypothetical protein
MRAAEPGVPAGFVRFTVHGTEIVCAGHIEAALREAVSGRTLYAFAATHHEARALAGRGIAYAVPLPGDIERVVVRHNRHGGLLAPATRDLFAPPTRAPYELAIAERLRILGVPTPRMLGYVIYPAGPFRRADVLTREVPGSADLSTALSSTDSIDRRAALAAAASLIHTLSDAGARHHDLNIKNVLLHEDTRPVRQALVLDVDRVTLGEPPFDALNANLARILRSARKWREAGRTQVTERELEEFVSLAGVPGIARAITLS